MPTPTDTNNFDDGDQMDAFDNDHKASDNVAASTKQDAQAAIDTFLQATDASVWTGLDRQNIGTRLRALVDAPRSIRQGGLNLCGPAAFLTCWIHRDPVAFVAYATGLFQNGSASIGSLNVTAAPDLLAQDFSAIQAAAGTEQADWMTLGALKNSNANFWQGTWSGDPSQDVAGMTTPGQVVDWLNATGLYQSVNNQANLATSAGIPQAESLLNSEGQDTILLIHINLFTGGVLDSVNVPDASFQSDHDGWLLRQFPNHWIVLLSEVTQAATPDGPGAVGMSFWSWGSSYLRSQADASGASHPLIQIPQDRFVSYYYGSITATMKTP